jgi:hypothetical protein
VTKPHSRAISSADPHFTSAGFCQSLDESPKHVQYSIHALACSAPIGVIGVHVRISSTESEDAPTCPSEPFRPPLLLFLPSEGCDVSIFRRFFQKHQGVYISLDVPKTMAMRRGTPACTMNGQVCRGRYETKTTPALRARVRPVNGQEK